MDTLTAAQRSERMSLIRGSKNKGPELKLIELMKAHGVTGWRRGAKVMGAPDFVWRQERLAIFVDGCFWHGCPRHRRVPKSRIEFWEAKLTANRRRDRLVSRTLRAEGWTVLRVWECSLSLKRRPATLRRLRRALEAARVQRIPRSGEVRGPEKGTDTFVPGPPAGKFRD